MFEVGQVCIKLAGRDAGNYCVVVQKLDERYVLIEGNVRRRKCNIAHLQPQKQKLDIKEGASHDAVVAAFKKADIEVKPKRGFVGKAVKKGQGEEGEKAQKREKPEIKPEEKATAKAKPAKKTSAKKKD